MDHHLYAVMPTTCVSQGRVDCGCLKEEFAVRCRSAKDCSLTVVIARVRAWLIKTQGLGALLEVNNGITAAGLASSAPLVALVN